MPRAIKPKTGHGRTAVETPVTLECLQKINSRITQAINGQDVSLFTEDEIEALYGRLHFRYVSLFFDGTRPAEPEQRAAIKQLEKAAQRLVKAAREYETCLDDLDIQTAKHFQISALSEALAQAENLHMQAMVAAQGLKERKETAGAPVKQLQKGVAELLVIDIKEKYPKLLVECPPVIGHGGIRKQNAKYNPAAFCFIKSCMVKAFPKAKPGTIDRMIRDTIDQKINFSAKRNINSID